MEYGINIEYFLKSCSLAKSAKMLSNAGFTMLDYTPPINQDDWKDCMKNSLKIFNDNGLTVHQTHAPFNFDGRCGSKDQHKLYLDRCEEATEYMGAKYMVVHGDEFDFENFKYAPELAFEFNHKYFLPYVERSKGKKYKLAFETLFSDHKGRFTANPQELLDLIASYKSDSVVCCWDFGHAHVDLWSGAYDWIRKFGKLIKCTHVHDNVGNDSHQMPFTGVINWSETMKAIKEIGYQGVMSIEYSHGKMPEDMMENFVELTYKAVKHLWEKL